MKFLAIDFETANEKWHSVCAVGLVRVENGVIVDEYYSLVDPEEYFSPFNIAVHGITEKNVQGMPKFRDVSNELLPLLSGNLVVAHNASFDVNVLRKVADKYDITLPRFSYTCTCKIAKKTWGDLRNYRLSTVAEHLCLDLVHHNALSDARACANILLQAIKAHGCNSMELTQINGIKIRQI